MEPQRKTKVLHFTTTVGGGGAEKMLCSMLETIDAMKESKVENVVVSTTSSWHQNSLRPRIEKSARFTDLEIKSLISPQFVQRYWNVVRKERPDVVQTWMHTSGLVAGGIAKLAGVKRVIWGIHSRSLLDKSRPLWKRMAAKMLLGFSAKWIPKTIVSCSRDGLEHHCDAYGYPRQKMVWIGNGIDVEKFRPKPSIRKVWREELGIAPEAPVFGMVTRMNPVKDIPTFLRAAALMGQRHPKARFVIAGLSRDELDEECAGLGAIPRVHFLGFQSAMEDVFPLFDVLTVTSVTEAYPMVLLEAKASGTLCVSTDVGDAKIMVGEEGWIVPKRNPEAVVQAWEEFIDFSEDEREARREANRVKAIENDSIERSVNSYLALYAPAPEMSDPPSPDLPLHVGASAG